MAAQWTVLTFGDSWVDYSCLTWPQLLGQRFNAKVCHFAQGGSLCDDLILQAQQALLSPQVPKGPGGLLRHETLVVVHTCGNDFLQKVIEGLLGQAGGMGGLLGTFLGSGGGRAASETPEILKPNPGEREARVLGEFVEKLYRGGARHFLVSSVPIFLHLPIFNILWPILQGMINQGKLEQIGVSPGDPPQLVMEVQGAAVHERWEEMVEKFRKEHPDATCLFFDEVAALERLRAKIGEQNFDRNFFDFSMFHPSPFGHQQLALEAHRCAAMGIPALNALVPHPDAPQVPVAPRQAVSQEVQATAATAKDSGTVDEEFDPDLAEALRLSLEEESPQPLTVRVRNVKGDVSFSVDCDARWSTKQLRDAVLKAAPSDFAQPGVLCVLALKGKFLDDGPKTLAEREITDGTQLIAVVKAPGAKSPKAAAT